MGNISFDGFDEFADKLERLGKFDRNHISIICKAGADVVKKAYKAAVPSFSKYIISKKMKSGTYEVFPDKETSSGYRAFGAAVVYDQGRHGNGGQAYHKGAITTQKARPFFNSMMAAAEAETLSSMEKKTTEILDDL